MSINEHCDPKPESKGWYLVTFYQFNKEDDKDPDRFNDWAEFNGVNWEYDDYKSRCVIVKVLRREQQR